MRVVILSVAIGALLMGTAHAQYGIGSTLQSAGKAAENAVQSGVDTVQKGTNAVTNSVTNKDESQAKLRIEAQGYSNVTVLNKDRFGVWHAKAQKDGMPVNVALDTKGIVKTE